MATQWFYQVTGQETGPVDASELRRLAETGIVMADTFVRQGTSNRWVRAEEVRGLFQRTPAPSPSVVAFSQPPPLPPPLPKHTDKAAKYKKTRYDWQPEDFHPMHQCFFCKKHKAVTVDSEELYKVIRNTMDLTGYVVNYTRVLIPIPICSQCSRVHRQQQKRLNVLRVIAWTIATGVLFYWGYDPADWLICLVVFPLIAIPLSVVPLIVLVVLIFTWSIVFCRETDEVAIKEDYPVVKKLLSMGWQWTLPKTKYGERKSEQIDKESMDRLNAEFQLQARQVIADFLRWCEQEREVRTNRWQATLNGAPGG